MMVVIVMKIRLKCDQIWKRSWWSPPPDWCKKTHWRSCGRKMKILSLMVSRLLINKTKIGWYWSFLGRIWVNMATSIKGGKATWKPFVGPLDPVCAQYIPTSDYHQGNLVDNDNIDKIGLNLRDCRWNINWTKALMVLMMRNVNKILEDEEQFQISNSTGC